MVDAALATGKPVYGLNTGVGHNKDTRLPDEALRAMQRMLLVTHSGGVGEPAPTDVVRAAMMVRVVGMARGGSGATPAAAEVLIQMLNARVHPIVPLDGSVGAGDLGQMASIGLVVIGMGLISIATPWISPTVRDKWFSVPAFIALFPIPLMTVVALLGARIPIVVSV